MSAKKTNIVIGILVLIIACLSVSLYRVTRLSKEMYELNCRVPTKIPLDVFVTGMTEAVERYDRLRCDVASQNGWLRRHLEQTINRLEMEYKLEPIPVKTAYPGKGIILSEYIGDSDIFAIPYQKPEYQFPYFIDPNEWGLRQLETYLESSTHFFFLATYDTEYWIENFYERLQRLEQTIEAAKKGN